MESKCKSVTILLSCLRGAQTEIVVLMPVDFSCYICVRMRKRRLKQKLTCWRSTVTIGTLPPTTGLSSRKTLLAWTTNYGYGIAFVCLCMLFESLCVWNRVWQEEKMVAVSAEQKEVTFHLSRLHFVERVSVQFTPACGDCRFVCTEICIYTYRVHVKDITYTDEGLVGWLLQ